MIRTIYKRFKYWQLLRSPIPLSKEYQFTQRVKDGKTELWWWIPQGINPDTKSILSHISDQVGNFIRDYNQHTNVDFIGTIRDDDHGYAKVVLKDSSFALILRLYV